MSLIQRALGSLFDKFAVDAWTPIILMARKSMIRLISVTICLCFC